MWRGTSLAAEQPGHAGTAVVSVPIGTGLMAVAPRYRIPVQVVRWTPRRSAVDQACRSNPSPTRGQPAPERVAYARPHPGGEAETQLTEVIGQRKLLKWSVHAATFWGFIILIFTIIEAYGDLFSRMFAIPGLGHSPALGFLEDLFAWRCWPGSARSR